MSTKTSSLSQSNDVKSRNNKSVSKKKKKNNTTHTRKKKTTIECEDWDTDIDESSNIRARQLIISSLKLCIKKIKDIWIKDKLDLLQLHIIIIYQRKSSFDLPELLGLYFNRVFQKKNLVIEIVKRAGYLIVQITAPTVFTDWMLFFCRSINNILEARILPGFWFLINYKKKK